MCSRLPTGHTTEAKSDGAGHPQPLFPPLKRGVVGPGLAGGRGRGWGGLASPALFAGAHGGVWGLRPCCQLTNICRVPRSPHGHVVCVNPVLCPPSCPRPHAIAAGFVGSGQQCGSQLPLLPCTAGTVRPDTRAPSWAPTPRPHLLVPTFWSQLLVPSIPTRRWLGRGGTGRRDRLQPLFEISVLSPSCHFLAFILIFHKILQ